MRIPVVVPQGQQGHCPPLEIQCGRAIPAFDSVLRIDAILGALSLSERVQVQDERAWDVAPVLRVHDEDLIEFLASAWQRLGPSPDDAPLIFADTFLHASLVDGIELSTSASRGDYGRYCFDTITGIGPRTFEAAKSSVAAALTAAAQLDQSSLSVALCRPPGHHVNASSFGGGCYLNNAAVTAQWLVDQGRDRVAILDLDFHHGNGTQSLFYARPDVLYASLHGNPDDWYPFFTGRPTERGRAGGEGYNLNVLLPPVCTGAQYIEVLSQAISVIDESASDVLIVSLGLDTAREDPSGDALLVADDYYAVGQAVAGLGLPTLVLLEGGYAIETLGENVAAWIDGFEMAQA